MCAPEASAESATMDVVVVTLSAPWGSSVVTLVGPERGFLGTLFQNAQCSASCSTSVGA